MKTVAAFFFCLICMPSLAQITTKVQPEKSVPAGYEYQGALLNVIAVEDKHGSSVIVVSQTPVQASKTWADSRETELFVYRYLTKPSGAHLEWRLYDFVKECPVNLEAKLLSGAEAEGISVTDLDGDQDAEVWIAYRLVCRGDMSPATLKIIMYEGKKEHSMRGKSKVKISDTQYAGGAFEFDHDLLDGPQVFRDYAKQLWDTIVSE
jgi:hypothetical protein